MKHSYLAPGLLFAVAIVTGCHSAPPATSADGKAIKVGQSVYPHRMAFGCKSLAELSQATSLKTQAKRQELSSYLKEDHCGFFEGNETANVVRIEKSDNDAALVVNLPDQASLPQLWVKSSDVSAQR
jgi:hypothetical protein